MSNNDSSQGTLRFDDATRERLRGRIMRKGRAVADELAELLAGGGGRVDVAALPVFAAKPGLRPEERLRLFLDHLEGCRELIDARDDAYGRCGACGADLGELALHEMPWADRCRQHAARPG